MSQGANWITMDHWITMNLKAMKSVRPVGRMTGAGGSTCSRRWYLRMRCTGFSRKEPRGRAWPSAACLSLNRRAVASRRISSVSTDTVLWGDNGDITSELRRHGVRTVRTVATWGQSRGDMRSRTEETRAQNRGDTRSEFRRHELRTAD